MSSLAFNFLLLQKLANLTEEDLDLIPVRFFKPLFQWMNKELLEEKVMTVEQWLSLAFHLCKQRWNQLDWLEQQPVSKILLMVKIQSDFVEKEKQEMKKSARKK